MPIAPQLRLSGAPTQGQEAGDFVLLHAGVDALRRAYGRRVKVAASLIQRPLRQVYRMLHGERRLAQREADILWRSLTPEQQDEARTAAIAMIASDSYRKRLIASPYVVALMAGRVREGRADES